jgi:hypothetical protein
MEPTTDIRRDFLKAVEKTLIGPKNECEQIDERPTEKYLYGLLWPSHMAAIHIQTSERIETESENPATDEILTGEDTEANSRDSLPSNLINRQSCIGISFCMPALCNEIEINVKYGIYTKADGDAMGDTWIRRQIAAKSFIDLRNGDLQKKEIETGRSIQVVACRAGNETLCTVSLINEAKTTDSTSDALCEAIIFQPRLEVTLKNHLAFVQRPIQLDLGSQESKLYEILYQSKRPICFGHGVSTGQSEDMKKIWTEWLPHYETPNVDKDCKRYFGDVPDKIFFAHEIAENPREDTVKLLRKFVATYTSWISTTKESIGKKPDNWRESLEKNMEMCECAANRMIESVDHMAKDERFFEAFRQANKAIALQNSWKDTVLRFKWRPFQLGFFLLVIESFISDDRASRSTADLLWFPTGGGKTEAYLGIMAFLLFKGSYAPKQQNDPGTQILVRYTLRLLTKQQFERAAALILASEQVRKIEGASNKDCKPFSIGLWIGRQATPNTRKDAKDKLLHSEIQDCDPRQLISCPCCGSALKWKFQQNKPVQPECSNTNCLIRGDLNIYTVDEDIYSVRPSIILGTSDKFVQIARNPLTSRLFRSSTGRQPELILQDELHLISGPLGSVAGLFEVAIDIICSKDIKAKVIGSTATIKSADKQIRSLFNRKCLQFPPSGIDYRDSCFALEDRRSLGRLYIGSTSVGRSPKFALASLVGACFFHANKMADEYLTCQDGLSDQTESYSTIVAYFNSLKELGGAAVLFQDDVADRLKNLAAEEQISALRIENQKELTSTRTQDELQEILHDLDKKRGDEGHIDICLSTNMISVGVDVSRLGLMIVNGQPKSKSEYIQATSRVGRKNPGIVVTLYNDSKVRDKSAFESFHSLHANIYKDVEVTSVTPFSPQCIEKVLPTSFVAACRHLSPVALTEPQIDAFQATVDYVQNEFYERCSSISPENAEYLNESIMDLRARWVEGQPNCYTSNSKGSAQNPLFVSAEKAALLEEGQYIFSLLSSVRSVEPQCKLRPAIIGRRA